MNMNLARTLTALCVLLAPAAAHARLGQVAALADSNGALHVFHVEAGKLYRTDQRAPSSDWASAQWIAGGVSGVTAARNADGRLEAFFLAGTSILHTWQTAPSGPWSAVAAFGGPAVDVAVGRHGSGRLDVFYAGTDGALHDVLQAAPSAGWLAPRWFASPAYEVVAAQNADGRLEAFWSAGSLGLEHRWETSPDGAWSAPAPFAGAGLDLTVAANGDGRLEVFYVGAGSQNLEHKWQTAPSGGWSTGAAIFAPAGTIATTAAVGTNHDGRLEVFYVDGFGNLGHAWQTAAGSSWTGFAQLGWQARSIAAASNADGRLEVFYVNAGGTPMHDWQLQPGLFWAGEYPLPDQERTLLWMDPLGPPVFVPPYGDWHVNDHTIVRAPDGTWRMFGIFAPNPGVSTDLFDTTAWLGAASAPTLEGPWTNQSPPFYEPQVSPYRALWAPHVINVHGVYVMAYCDGDGSTPEAYAINLRRSLDLQTWTAPTTVLTDGYQARDPMLFWNASASEWVLYYTATENRDQGHHIVAYVTSPDLIHFSTRGTAYTDFHWGSAYGPTESPFVVQRGGYYYLFIGPRPYDAPTLSLPNYEHPGYVGTDVFRSTRWDHWENADLVAHLPVHAAEVVQDTSGDWNVTSGGINQGGLKMARLHWNDGLGN